jgi:hypothetical protein
MGKRKHPQQNWKVQVEAVYRSDRDERIKKAYQLALPEVISNPSKKIIREEKENEPEYCNLCASL